MAKVHCLILSIQMSKEARRAHFATDSPETILESSMDHLCFYGVGNYPKIQMGCDGSCYFASFNIKALDEDVREALFDILQSRYLEKLGPHGRVLRTTYSCDRPLDALGFINAARRYCGVSELDKIASLEPAHFSEMKAGGSLSKQKTKFNYSNTVLLLGILGVILQGMGMFILLRDAALWVSAMALMCTAASLMVLSALIAARPAGMRTAMAKKVPSPDSMLVILDEMSGILKDADKVSGDFNKIVGDADKVAQREGQHDGTPQIQ